LQGARQEESFGKSDQTLIPRETAPGALGSMVKMIKNSRIRAVPLLCASTEYFINVSRFGIIRNHFRLSAHYTGVGRLRFQNLVTVQANGQRQQKGNSSAKYKWMRK
jgi:hypothetical protein